MHRSSVRYKHAEHVIETKDFWILSTFVFEQVKDNKLLQIPLKDASWFNLNFMRNPAADWYENNMKTLPEIIDSIYELCGEPLEHNYDYKTFNCSSLRFKADGRFNYDSQKLLLELEGAKKDLKEIEAKLTPEQKELAALNLEVQSKEAQSKSLRMKNAILSQKWPSLNELAILELQNRKLNKAFAATLLAGAGGTAAYYGTAAVQRHSHGKKSQPKKRR